MRMILVVALAAACLVSVVLWGCASGPSDHMYAGYSNDALREEYARDMEIISSEEGNAEDGKAYFQGEDVSGIPCGACHSFNAADTMTTDADGQVRVGASLYAARHRRYIRELSGWYASNGVKIVVPYWYDWPAGRYTKSQKGSIEAFLASQSGEPTHVTASAVDYKARRYTIPAVTTGGNAARGAELAQAYCRTCHEMDRKVAVYDIGAPRIKGGVVPTEKLPALADRIRNTGGSNNRSMPGFPDDRMPVQDLLDLLAYFEE